MVREPITRYAIAGGYTSTNQQGTTLVTDIEKLSAYLQATQVIVYIYTPWRDLRKSTYLLFWSPFPCTSLAGPVHQSVIVTLITVRTFKSRMEGNSTGCFLRAQHVNQLKLFGGLICDTARSRICDRDNAFQLM